MVRNTAGLKCKMSHCVDHEQSYEGTFQNPYWPSPNVGLQLCKRHPFRDLLSRLPVHAGTGMEGLRCRAHERKKTQNPNMNICVSSGSQ